MISKTIPDSISKSKSTTSFRKNHGADQGSFVTDKKAAKDLVKIDSFLDLNLISTIKLQYLKP